MTSTGRSREAEIRALKALLEIHGADRTRWPAAERLRFAPLIASDAGAQGLMAEAEALDRLLDHADEPEAAVPRALSDRVVAAAARESGWQGTASAPVRTRDGLAGRSATPRTAGAAAWSVPALLAASLVVGVLAGASGMFDPAMAQFASGAGIAGGDEPWGDEIAGLFEEEER